MSTGFNLKSPAYNKGGSLSFKALKPGTGSPNYGSHGWNLLPTEAGSPTLRICRLVQLRSWTISAALMDDLSRAHGRSQPRSRAISAALMGNLSGIFWVTSQHPTRQEERGLFSPFDLWGNRSMEGKSYSRSHNDHTAGQSQD